MSTPPQHPPRPSKAAVAQASRSSPSQDVERALALRAVMDHAVRVQREISKPTLLRRSRARLVWATVVCVPLIALSAYSWIARPAFIWGPSDRSVSAERKDADIRFAMYLLAQRVESYRGAGGPYPASLDALGEKLEGVSYRVISDSVFELRASQDGKPVVFRSNEDVDVFLGNSPSFIQDRRP